MKTKIKKVRIVGLMLVFAMLFSCMGVFAEEPAVTIPNNFEVVAVETEALDDGLVLERSLAIDESKARGFSGTIGARVEHKYIMNGNLIGYVASTAVFSSMPGQNVCYLEQGTYAVLEQSDGLNIYDFSENFQTNQGVNAFNRWAKYTLNYKTSKKLNSTMTGNRSMWVRCDSVGNTSTSGDKEYTSGSKIFTFN